jgi:hypothetical protein
MDPLIDEGKGLTKKGRAELSEIAKLHNTLQRT